MRDATVVVPPSKTARVSRRRPRSRARDRTITDVRTLGRRRWKQEAGYPAPGAGGECVLSVQIDSRGSGCAPGPEAGEWPSPSVAWPNWVLGSVDGQFRVMHRVVQCRPVTGRSRVGQDAVDGESSKPCSTNACEVSTPIRPRVGRQPMNRCSRCVGLADLTVSGAEVVHREPVGTR